MSNRVRNPHSSSLLLGGDTGKHISCTPNHLPLIPPTPRLRSYLGYPPVRDAQPNPIHYALAALQHSSVTPQIITQNVDGLHHKAIKHLWNEARRKEDILELHGTLHVSVSAVLPPIHTTRIPTSLLSRRYIVHMGTW